MRPTSSKVRQAFFNILSNRLAGARFLDLCAGSGLMGMEALSRGAKWLVAVEEDKRFSTAIRDNLKRFGFDGEVITADVRKALPVLEKHAFDIVFTDPPYKSALPDTILRMVSEHELLSERGVLAIEHAPAAGLAEETEQLERYDSRKYGQTLISFYRRKDGTLGLLD